MSSLMNFLVQQTGNNYLTVLLALSIAVIILRETFLYQSQAKPFIYYTFLFPGIIAHELAHATICLITLTKIKSIKFFSTSGGFVIHDKPRFLPISFLISIAPLISGIAIIYFSLIHSGFLSSSIYQIISPKLFVIVYFLSSILLTMLPSKQDIFNALSSFIAVTAGFIAYYLLVKEKSIFGKINMLVLYCLILLIALNLLIFIINKVWKSK